MTDLAVPDLAGSDAAHPASQSARSAEVSDYLALLKPRVMSLAVFTALVGMVIAPDAVHPAIALTALIAISVGAGASGALNMWYDADIDRLMQRTAKRPIPRGRLAASDALAFGVILAAFSVITLGLLVNWLAGGLLALTIGFYLFIYTMWLKRRTPQNIVIGGAAGAFPPMIGWAAATGSLAIEPIILFLVIFLWTPPHFWALALYRARDYERAGIPMLPVVAGRAETKRQILIYSLLLVPVGIAPVALGFGGWLYAGVSIGLGAIFLALAIRLYRGASGQNDAETIAAEDRLARQLFAFSILYLFLIFASLLAEHGLGVRL